MEKRMKICYIDRCWYDAERKAVNGDMGFSFQDAPDTRKHIKDYDELVASAVAWVNDPTSEWEFGNGIDTDFAIYEVVVADAVYDEEDLDIDDPAPEEDDNLWSYNVEGAEVREIVLGITEEEITEEVLDIIKKAYPSVERIHYRIGE